MADLADLRIWPKKIARIDGFEYHIHPLPLLTNVKYVVV